MGANRERIEQLRRAFENGSCEHDDFMCTRCEWDAIERALDAAVAEAVAAERLATGYDIANVRAKVNSKWICDDIADAIRARSTVKS